MLACIGRGTHEEGAALALTAVVAASMISLARRRTRPLASIASDALYDGLLPRALPTFSLPVLKATERGLVIGMGGGCDVMGALAVAQAWQQVSEPGATIIFGNCVSPRPMPDNFVQLGPHLWRCPAEVVPLQPADGAYGSARIEQSLPRGAEGSPLLFVIPRNGKGRPPPALADVTAANSAALATALAEVRPDRVVGVDLGGDSLTGGVDFESDPECGRDRQVLHALRASRVPCVHLVLGPGCDGESSVEAMSEAVRRLDSNGALLGVLPLDDLIGPLSRYGTTLAPNRTPNIIKAAFERRAKLATLQPQACTSDGGLCTICRHGHTAQVPWAWLTVALALDV